MSHFDPSTHPLSKKELEHYTNLWCREQGIHSKDLETHPQIDDVLLLVNWRNAMWSKSNLSDRGFWSSQWDWVYYKKFSLKTKNLQKLEMITMTANTRHLSKIIHQAKARQKIQAMRRHVAPPSTKQKADHDMTDKGSAPDTTDVPWY